MTGPSQPTEHSERYGQIWAAQTRGELVVPLADLGGTIEILQVQRVVAVFSKILRAISASTQRVYVKATFGAIVLDLTAMRSNQEIDVHASSFCGKVVIMVPDNATVVDRGDVFLGKRAALRTSPPPGGPVIRIDGRSSFGNLKVFRASEVHPGVPGYPSGQVGQLHQHLHIHHDRHVHHHRQHYNSWDGYW